MSSMDVPADLPKQQSAASRTGTAATPTLTWVTLALMTTASVASLRAAPTMAVYGLACVFLYLVPAIVFLLPTALVSAELASGWSGASTAGWPRGSPSRWGSSRSGASSP